MFWKIYEGGLVHISVTKQLSSTHKTLSPIPKTKQKKKTKNKKQRKSEMKNIYKGI